MSKIIGRAAPENSLCNEIPGELSGDATSCFQLSGSLARRWRSTGQAGMPVRLTHLDPQRALDVVLADARAFLGRAGGRGIQFHRQPAAPADFIELFLDRRKIHAALSQCEENGIFHGVVALTPLLCA